MSYAEAIAVLSSTDDPVILIETQGVKKVLAALEIINSEIGDILIK